MFCSLTIKLFIYIVEEVIVQYQQQCGVGIVAGLRDDKGVDLVFALLTSCKIYIVLVCPRPRFSPFWCSEFNHCFSLTIKKPLNASQRTPRSLFCFNVQTVLPLLL